MVAGSPHRTILLAGAGHAHVEVLRAFAREPVAGARIAVATPNRFTPYSGMLPGLVAGLYGFAEAHVDVQRLAATAGARFIEQAIVGLDHGSREARCANGDRIAYDILSLDIGSTPATLGVPGAAEYAIPVKPISAFLPRFDALVARVRSGDINGIALVGAGAGGIELALAVERPLRRAAASLALHVVASGERILPDLPTDVARRLGRCLAKRNIDVRLKARVTAVEPRLLHFADLPPLPVDAVLWVTQAAAPPWLAATGLRLDPSGFVVVGAGLDVPGRPDVFAAGDVAAFAPRPLPKAGVHAVRQGPVLARNIRRCVAGLPPLPYRPRRDALVLISTGERHAVGTRNGLVVEGGWVWRIKDWLDRRWMRRYQET